MKASIAAAVTIGAAAVLATPTAPLVPRASGTSSGSLPTVTVKGNAFWAGAERFYIRGVDYQPGGSSDVVDPLADPTTCKRDIAKFSDLGLNTVRVYSVDNSADHDECMTALADAGIYLVLDVNTPLYSLNRAEPAASYNDVYLQSIFATIDMFSQYSNTLAFFSGNEVINDGPTSAAAPYVKAVTRDMRQYIRNRGYRHIPVGYSAADVSENRYQMATYMNCGTDDERSDFFAFNDYSWCDPSSFTTSGWDQKVANFTGYSIPIFLSEYGCNTNERKFEEVASIYSTQMSAVYSGGLVYEYSEEGSNYGLVEISGDTITDKSDYDALKSALAAQANPSGDGGYLASGTASDCPAESKPDWAVSGDALPAIPSPALKYMTNGAGKGPGLKGDGSQNAGTGSSGTATPGSGSATATAVTATGTGSSSGSSTSSSASSSSSASAGTILMGEASYAPLVCTLVVAISSLMGAALL